MKSLVGHDQHLEFHPEAYGQLVQLMEQGVMWTYCDMSRTANAAAF